MFSEIQNWINIGIMIGSYALVLYVVLQWVGLIAKDVAPKVMGGTANGKYYLQLVIGLAAVAFMYMTVPALMVYAILYGWENVRPYVHDVQSTVIEDVNTMINSGKSGGEIRYNEDVISPPIVPVGTIKPPASEGGGIYGIDDGVGGGVRVNPVVEVTPPIPDPTINPVQPNVTVVPNGSSPTVEPTKSVNWTVGDPPTLP